MNIIFIPCPKCGRKYSVEIELKNSKVMNIHHYDLDDAPKNLWIYINKHSPFECLNCGSKFNVKFVQVTIPQPTLIEG